MIDNSCVLRPARIVDHSAGQFIEFVDECDEMVVFANETPWWWNACESSLGSCMTRRDAIVRAWVDAHPDHTPRGAYDSGRASFWIERWDPVRSFHDVVASHHAVGMTLEEYDRAYAEVLVAISVVEGLALGAAIQRRDQALASYRAHTHPKMLARSRFDSVAALSARRALDEVQRAVDRLLPAR